MTATNRRKTRRYILPNLRALSPCWTAWIQEVSAEVGRENALRRRAVAETQAHIFSQFRSPVESLAAAGPGADFLEKPSKPAGVMVTISRPGVLPTYR